MCGHEGTEHAYTPCRLPPAAAAPLPPHLFRTKPSCTTKHIVNKSHTFSRLPPSRATETAARMMHLFYGITFWTEMKPEE
jgi:hypothetical protein